MWDVDLHSFIKHYRSLKTLMLFHWLHETVSVKEYPEVTDKEKGGVLAKLNGLMKKHVVFLLFLLKNEPNKEFLCRRATIQFSAPPVEDPCMITPLRCKS